MATRGRPAPDWLKNLEKGSYTMKELTEISGKKKSNISLVMKKHGCLSTPKRVGEKIVYYYDWGGLR